MNEYFMTLMERLCSMDWLTEDGMPMLPKRGTLPFGWCPERYVYVFSADIRGLLPRREYTRLLQDLFEDGYIVRGYDGANENTAMRKHPFFGPCRVVIFRRKPVENFIAFSLAKKSDV